MLLGTKAHLNHATRNDYRAALGPDPMSLYRAVRDAGLGFLEWPLAPRMDHDALWRLVNDAAEHGIRSHFHPYPEGEVDGSRFEDRSNNPCRRSLEEQLRFAHQVGLAGGYTPIVNLHAGNPEREGPLSVDLAARERSLPRCAALFRWISRFREAEGLRVQVTNEVQQAAGPSATFFRFGDRFSELLAMVQDAPGIGLCWDMGHSTLNHGLWGGPEYPLDPPAEMLALVRHVHLHDIDPSGQDHLPLVYGAVDWPRYLPALRESGYTGAINLEMTPPMVADVGPYQGLMALSAAKVRAAWEAACAGSPAEQPRSPVG